MSSEKRVVRPYVGVDAFQDMLGSFRLRIGPEALEPGDHRTVTSSSFTGDPVRLIPAPGDHLDRLRSESVDAVRQLGLALSDVDLVVLASTPYLRLLDVVHRVSLDDPAAIPADLVLDADSTLALRTPSGGVDIEVCFVVNAHQPPKPLHPWRKGTWLGRIRFELRTELGELGFTPQPLTADRRAQFALPDATVRFVQVSWDDLVGEDMSEAVDLYVDETLLTLVNSSPHSPGALAFQRQLFVDVMAAIVREAGRADIAEWDLADIDDTVLGRVVAVAAGPGPKSEPSEEKRARMEHAFHLLKEKPEVFLARLEAAAAPRNDLQQTITGPDE